VARQALGVWLYGSKIAVLSEPTNRRLRLGFNQEAEERFRPQSLVLSTSMPIDVSRRPNGVPVRVFFHGLLPEAEARVRISEEFGITNGDDFGLLAAIGRDCAGAVVLQPEGERAPSTTAPEGVLETGDLERAVEEIRERPLGAADDVRVSLAGVQDKLLLTQHSDGRWRDRSAVLPRLTS
jgi:serine/threonine-protein kinase HipA